MADIRVTDQMLYLGALPGYNALLAAQLAVQQQISSGKRFSSADQDPLAVAQAQRLHTQDAHLAQDLSNTDEITASTQSSEDAVNSAISSIQRAQELAVEAGDATKSDSDLQDMAQEVDQLLQGLIDVGNQTYNGHALFGGTNTEAAPFQAVTDATGKITGVTYNGNQEAVAAEVAPGQNLTYNLLGSNENGGSFGLLRDVNANVDLFQTLIDFRDNLTSNRGGVTASLQDLNTDLAHLTAASAQIGGMENRVSNAVSLQQNQRDHLATLLSSVEDTDIAQASTTLATLQTSYQAALEAGAKIGQLSLVNYLPTT